ncbi:MAG: hypothetical protein ACK56F_22945, partial [bacterium]
PALRSRGRGEPAAGVGRSWLAAAPRLAGRRRDRGGWPDAPSAARGDRWAAGCGATRATAAPVRPGAAVHRCGHRDSSS